MTSSPRKRIRPDAEIAALATQFSADWTAGDAVLTWLRRHVAALTRMIHDDGWSWPDLARALTLAGIGYRSGRPWTGDLLRKKAAAARTLRRRTSVPAELSAEALTDALRQAASAPAPACQAGPSSAQKRLPAPRTWQATDAMALGPFDDDEGDLEPAFGFARLKGWSPPAPQPEGAASDPPSSLPAAPAADEQSGRAEALERFLRRPRRNGMPMPLIPEPEDE